MRLATVEGLDGLSIGTLARATELSKSGVYAHFDSKEALQLATIDNARALFIDVVVAPALELGRARPSPRAVRVVPGLRREPHAPWRLLLRRRGRRARRPARSRCANGSRRTRRTGSACSPTAANEAVALGELRGDTDVATLVFELNALVIAANTAYILHDDPAVLTQARTAIERVILAATPA